jgi:hypothetical protein
MMTDVFCAYLLDTWNNSSSVERDPLFLSVLAGRMSFGAAIKKARFRSHEFVLLFASFLERPDLAERKAYPLFFQALDRVARVTQADERKRIHWDRECLLFAQALGRSVTRLQVASSAQAPSYSFGTFVRVYRQLLGGSRTFHHSSLLDASWIGRVRAFTQRITF